MNYDKKGPILMYTVLLVDDETAVLESLIQGIHWQQYGVSSVLTASDGTQAMEVLSKHAVDLMITDIRMPHKDGLSLLGEVRATYPNTHCIILTAYEEFEYARQAVLLGAENYLLKPLDIEEMEESIERALDNIYASRKISDRLFRNNIFTRWMSRAIATNELAERANLLQLNLYLPEYCTVILRKKQSSLSLSSFCQSCVEQLQVHYDTHHFKDDNGDHIFIIGGGQINAEKMVSLLSAEAGNKKLSHLIMISVGSIVSSADNVPDSYDHARKLMDDATVQSLQSSAPLGLTVLMDDQYSVQDENSLIQQLTLLFQASEESHSANSFGILVDQLLEIAKANSLQAAQVLISHSLLKLFAQEFPNQPEAQEQLNNRIRMTRSAADTEAFASDLPDLLEFSRMLHRYHVNQMHPLIQSALHYIHTKYAESISIPEFCNQAKVSSPYLGYLFKKETGYFFNNYLTQHRIYCSIPLLLDTDMRISDIAANVGFTSASYYITRFKQQIGLSPIKYRAQIR